ncbi:MAG: YwiC-like family protein [Acidobacteria bacterium]|nr:YwiC-like family protein [Acidobacteriota bacterium]
MGLFPKEHGAYGQISFPLIAAFAVAGASMGGVLVAAATIAGFLAHEPALAMLGFRGARAKRDIGRGEAAWLAGWLLAGVVAGLGALLAIEPQARWSLLVPLVPAALLAAAAARGAEKSWYGETAASLAFSGVAVPIAMAAGLPLPSAAALAIPFALLFVASTLAVRVVILRVRRGGDSSVASTRSAALAVAMAGSAALALATALGAVPASVMAAAAPGLLMAIAIAVRPPAPSHLRTLGWTLIAMSVVTTLIVVFTV